jgi:hypothetical protein
MASLRNIDLTDRELLHVIYDIANGEPVSSHDVGLALGISPNGSKNKTAATRVAQRLSWMKRYGFLERVSPLELEGGKVGDPVLWLVTEIGRQIMSGKLSRTLEQSIDRARPGDQVLLMRKLTQRAYVQAGPEIATAVRREYLHNAAQRSP